MIDPQKREKKMIRDRRRGNEIFPFVLLAVFAWVVAEEYDLLWCYALCALFAAIIAFLGLRK